MKASTTCLLLASTATATAAAVGEQQHPGKQVDIRPRAVNGTSYLTKMADTWVGRGLVKDFGYAVNVLYSGVEMAIELTGSETYAAWYERLI